VHGPARPSPRACSAQSASVTSVLISLLREAESLESGTDTRTPACTTYQFVWHLQSKSICVARGLLFLELVSLALSRYPLCLAVICACDC
jgi:hypothetical protein